MEKISYLGFSHTMSEPLFRIYSLYLNGYTTEEIVQRMRLSYEDDFDNDEVNDIIDHLNTTLLW